MQPNHSQHRSRPPGTALTPEQPRWDQGKGRAHLCERSGHSSAAFPMEVKRGESVLDEHPTAPLPTPAPSEAGWARGWSVGASAPKPRESVGDLCCSTHGAPGDAHPKRCCRMICPQHCQVQPKPLLLAQRGWQSPRAWEDPADAAKPHVTDCHQLQLKYSQVVIQSFVGFSSISQSFKPQSWCSAPAEVAMRFQLKSPTVSTFAI